MNLEDDALTYSVLLLPGFAAYRVFAAMTVRKRQPALITVSEIMLFELIVLALYGWFVDATPQAFLGIAQNPGSSGDLTINWKGIVGLTATSVAVGMLAGALFNWDRLLGPLRILEMTRQSAHPSVWQAAFQHKRGWVVVHLENELRIKGFVRFFSDTPVEAALYLEDASFLSRSEPSIAAGDLLLAKTSQICMIQFLESDEDASGEHRKQS